MPRQARRRSRSLVATGNHFDSKAGKATIKVKLSAAARRLMKGAKS
jgi:hypothetical protein